MKIFITGASGYIGGSLAEYLRDAGHNIVGLVRREDNASALRQRGIAALVGHLADPIIIAQATGSADVVVNTAEADNIDLVMPLVAALAGTGKTLIHTGGSSIVVDDAKGDVAGTQIFTDDSPFSPLDHRLPRVSVDRSVRRAGITEGIRAAVISPTMVYGKGRGLKRDSHQIPTLAAKSLERGAGVFIGRGAPIWSSVYLGDLLALYALAIEKAPSGAFFFAESQESSFSEIATAISHSLGFEGRTESWLLDEAVSELGGVARVALATNCRVRALNARRLLGWRPTGPSLSDALRNHA